MSWSLSVIGRAADVAQKAAEALEKQHCSEPEQTIKAQVGSAIATALGAFPANWAVKVDANGSQWHIDASGTAVNSLSLTVSPFWQLD